MIAGDVGVRVAALAGKADEAVRSATAELPAAITINACFLFTVCPSQRPIPSVLSPRCHGFVRGQFGGNMSRRRTRTPSGLPRHGVRTARRLTVSSVFSFSRTRSVARFGTVTTLKRPVSTGRRGQAIPIRRRMGGPRERRWDTVGGPECSGGDGHDGSRAPNHEDLQDRRHQQPLPRPPRLNRQAWAGGRVDVYIPASASASASAWTRSVAALISARWERP